MYLQHEVSTNVMETEMQQLGKLTLTAFQSLKLTKMNPTFNLVEKFLWLKIVNA